MRRFKREASKLKIKQITNIPNKKMNQVILV
jgi:hypothetical protein